MDGYFEIETSFLNKYFLIPKGPTKPKWLLKVLGNLDEVSIFIFSFSKCLVNVENSKSFVGR